ncbi:MAG: CpaF/VirB11 family protein [Acidimicrobiia bacterium]
MSDVSPNPESQVSGELWHTQIPQNVGAPTSKTGWVGVENAAQTANQHVAQTILTPNMSGLDTLFSDNPGTRALFRLLDDPDVQDVRANSHNSVFFTDSSGPRLLHRIFSSPQQYEEFIDGLLALTDVGYKRLADAKTSVVEGSFDTRLTVLKGSVIVATSDLTRGEPALVVRKQPKTLITLDEMLEENMMSQDMRLFLEAAVRGRLNMLISGSSGAGKTTLARALSWFVDPSQRVLTVEEINELHLVSRLPNVVSLVTYRDVDEQGRVIREETLEDLVRHALRMRADRIWVGETRGKEAYALSKACLSGHDGSVTTLHANNTAQAIEQLVSYTMEAGIPEEVARDQVANAFHLAIQIKVSTLGRRVITEIVELEPVREGARQRRNPLWVYDQHSDMFIQQGQPSPRLLEALARYNVNISGYLGYSS